MYRKLKMDVLKALSRDGVTVYAVGGIGGLVKHELEMLLRICDIYETEYDIGKYRNEKLRTEVVNVLKKYKMW